MLDTMKNEGEPFNRIVDRLNQVNFRKKRNDATHYKNISLEELLPVQEVLMKQDGVYNEINDLLND